MGSNKVAKMTQSENKLNETIGLAIAIGLRSVAKDFRAIGESWRAGLGPNEYEKSVCEMELVQRSQELVKKAYQSELFPLIEAFEVAFNNCVNPFRSKEQTNQRTILPVNLFYELAGYRDEEIADIPLDYVCDENGVLIIDATGKEIPVITKYRLLKGGLLAALYPSVFPPIVLSREGEIEEPVFRHNELPKVMNFYAVACELLAELVTNHLSVTSSQQKLETTQPTDSGIRTEIRTEALAHIVAGDLAGVLHAAGSLRSVDKITQVMRTMCANDNKYYEWTVDMWCLQLKAAKKTVIESKAWKEIMAWRTARKESAVIRGKNCK